MSGRETTLCRRSSGPIHLCSHSIQVYAQFLCYYLSSSVLCVVSVICNFLILISTWYIQQTFCAILAWRTCLCRICLGKNLLAPLHLSFYNWEKKSTMNLTVKLDGAKSAICAQKWVYIVCSLYFQFKPCCAIFILLKNLCAIQEDNYFPHGKLQCLIWDSLYRICEPLLDRWPFKKLREKALQKTIEHIHYEDENTRYITIGYVEKVIRL